MQPKHILSVNPLSEDVPGIGPVTSYQIVVVDFSTGVVQYIKKKKRIRRKTNKHGK